MQFVSTNKKAPAVDFQTALFAGLAPDGGLYLPTEIPQFSSEELSELPGKSLPEIGELVLQKWLPDIPPKDLWVIVKQALTFPLPLKTVGDRKILELFHGPTKAFKDVAAGVLAQLFEYYLQKEKTDLTILVATSGDTGGAIAQAFSGIDRVKVIILFPEGRVSALQEEQLTRVGENVFPLLVAGNFDDCQAIVKQAFLDPELASANLSSANSINIGRLLPQIIYYVWTYAQLPSTPIQFIVPSGNMGNVTAGLFAAKMGMPFSSFVIATNENDSVVKYYETGVFHKQPTNHTLSTAMDIGNPSNFIRALELFHHDHAAFCKAITAIKISDSDTTAMIKKIYKENQYLLDFHTAVGFAAAERVPVKDKQQVVLSTASPIKFAAELKGATGIVVDDSAEIKKLQKRTKRGIPVSNKYESIKTVIKQRLSL